ncbi:aquaporin-8-like isoform X1 [Pomacea canaliculata]|uniref:aquaporin-8-like isoform X1 n=1 Tax=Pomacea canaliculata TaxID=400727 RepID=UPI000D732569|nr:aquaporin-8-like isoform X1 [Pomacea canaliculata]
MPMELNSFTKSENSQRVGSLLYIFEEFVRPALAEFFGVTLFVCVGCLAVTQSGGGSVPGAVPFSAVSIALAHGLTIALLVCALGSVSGAHLNPAVTLGVLLAGGISIPKAVIYFISQLIGSMTGAALARGILPASVYELIGGGAHNLGSFAKDSVTPGQGVLCEMVLTMVLVMTVLLTAVDPITKTTLAPLAIGFAVTVDILAGILITGASMNPARSFGPAVAIAYHDSDIWNYHYVYWVGPLVGSAIAASWYRFFLASSEKRLILANYEPMQQ